MLKRVEIREFRSCKDVVLDDLGSITALVGRNGAGKTNILQAVYLAAQLATGPRPDFHLIRSPFKVKFHFEVNGRTYCYNLDAGLQSDPSVFVLRDKLETTDTARETVFERDGETVSLGHNEVIRIGISTATLPALLSILPESSPKMKHLRPISSFFSSIRYYPLDEPNVVNERIYVDEIEYNHWRANASATDHANDSVIMRTIQLALEQPAKLQELKSLLGIDGLGLVHDIALDEWRSKRDRTEGPFGSNRYFGLRFDIDPGCPIISYESLSLGTRRVMRILVSLLTDDSSVTLLEHPEDGIHRGLLRKLIALLRTYTDPGQVILTSHSSVVVNSLEPEETRLVSMADGQTHVRALTPRELDAAEQFLENEGTFDEFLSTVQSGET